MSDGEKISFSELDKKRREKKQNGGGQRRGRRKNGRWAAESYKRRIDERLFGKKGDAGRMRVEQRLQQAQGTPDFSRVYREYVRGYGMPEDLNLLLLLLDLDDEREAVKVVDALEIAVKTASPDVRSLLKRRLQTLEMSTSSDALADAASELLSRL